MPALSAVLSELGKRLSQVEIGRPSSAAAERVSSDLRRGQGRYLRDRRRATALALLATGALGVVEAYQSGLIGSVPEPRVGPLRSVLDADAVDAAGEAYELLHTPDSALGIASYGLTLVLLGAGAGDRAQQTPWWPVLAGAKAVADAGNALYLFAEQLTKHRRICSWCTVAAAANVAALPLALPEARAALPVLWRRLRQR
ncbi:MAG: vitamin K epoxide reductase family protein [Actinomycetales bacterium]